jgi:hypothetical protein
MDFEQALKSLKVGMTVHIEGYSSASAVISVHGGKIWLHNLHGAVIQALSGYGFSSCNGRRYLIDSIFVDGQEVVRPGFSGIGKKPRRNKCFTG